MSRFSDIRKTLDYLRRNGIGAAVTAVRERLMQEKESYHYEEPSAEILKEQRALCSRRIMEKQKKGETLMRFSILVPAYLTDKRHLAEMIESVKRQTYGEWELLIADASPEQRRLEYAVTEAARDARVRYLHLPKNGGISANTNAALSHASGQYVVLLDHDDLLTPDALFAMEEAICGEESASAALPWLVYSDEDKFTDEEGPKGETLRRYFHPHKKGNFDPELLLSNNYICHLSVVRTDIAKKLRFRSAFDGAQDYDLFLRIMLLAWQEEDGKKSRDAILRRHIRHVPKTLYHWRVHDASTAGNPASKKYAYEAGKNALADCADKLLSYAGKHAGAELSVRVTDLKHRGFYRIDYEPDLFPARPDIGIIGGRVSGRDGTLCGGKMDAKGRVYYEGTKKGFSGGLQHPAVLTQGAGAVDIRCMRLRRELFPLYQEMCLRAMADETDDEEKIRNVSIAFCQAVRRRGYGILWDPQMEAVRL